MRPLLVLALLLLLGLQDVMALQKANAQDYDEIADQIKTKKKAEIEIALKEAALRKPRADKAALNIEIADLKVKQKNAAEQAIWLTMRAYDIIPFVDNEPILPKGFSVLRSPEIGTKITWLPIFENNGSKKLQNEDRSDAGFRIVDNSIAGNTASDGVSRIFPAAFDNPVQLASYIIHEKRHFTQNTTVDEGDKKTTAELEVEAYEEEQRMLIDDVLGYPKDIASDQEKRLIAALFGEKGKRGQKDIKGKREIAREERAEADKSRGGRPLPERSLVSLPEDEIQRLIKQAKDQIEIAQRDHDERLRNTVAALAMRSCADPGSVTQAELDGLSRPHKADFKLISAYPSGLDGCSVWVYLDIEKGANAEQIRTKSLPKVQAPILQPTQPTEHLPVRAVKTPLFSSIFPQLKEFATAACRGLKLPPIYLLYGEYAFYDTAHDANLARNLTAGLDNCSRQLFYKIIDKTRAGGGRFELSSQWVKEIVAANPPAAEAPPSGAAPPGEAPPRRERREEQRHPVVIIPDPPWKGRSIKHAPPH